VGGGSKGPSPIIGHACPKQFGRLLPPVIHSHRYQHEHTQTHTHERAHTYIHTHMHAMIIHTHNEHTHTQTHTHTPVQEIPDNKGLPAFWVDTADRINIDTNSIMHKMHYGELKETRDWLPKGPITIGVTSGASTPDRAVGIDKLCSCVRVWVF